MAASLKQQSLSRDSNCALWLKNISVRLSKLGDASLQAADPGVAAASYDEIQTIARLLAKRDPGNELWPSDLWIALYKLSDAKLTQGDTTSARTFCAEALTVIRVLAASNSANVQRQLQLIMTLYRLASMEDGSERVRALKEALEILERLRDLGQLPPDKIGWLDQIRGELNALDHQPEKGMQQRSG